MLDEQSITLNAFAHATMRRRIRRTILSLVSLLLLIGVGTGAAYMTLVNHSERIGIKQAALLPNPGATPTPGETTPTREAAAGDAQNILLIGTDSRVPLATGFSGVFVLMHIGNGGEQVHLVQFPGGTYVDVPGHGKDRIDAAYGFGGPELLVRTVQKLLDVPVDHVAVITYDAFRDMTDTVGGVDVTAEAASSGRGYTTVLKGVNHFDGAAALGFVSERRLPGESDISRGRRQMAFIKALLLKSLTTDALANPIQLAQFMDVAAHNLTVDDEFSLAEMRSLTSGLKDLESKNIVSITAPINAFGKDPKGATVDLVDAPRMAVLSAALRRDDMASFALG
jgi:LCP family protein required for cell wall assembly